MTVQTLKALIAGRPVADITQDDNRLHLRYDPSWTSFRGAYPLSLSLPLALAHHNDEPIRAYLWGLLPDSELVLAAWGRQFHVSPRNPFALLSHVGEDCAGAVQLVTPQRLAQLEDPKISKVEWLNDTDVEARLAVLRKSESEWRRASDIGQFSLAGAQPKTALIHENERWGIPSGRIPTTHILKPPTGRFDGFAQNEHYCLALAAEIGLPTARSTVTRFGNEIAIVVERYDRAFTAAMAAADAAAAAAQAASRDTEAPEKTAQLAARATALAELAKSQPILRLHQEDMCQALGVMPTQKYQNEGGPSPADIVELLKTYSSRPMEDIWTFVSALVFNWVILGTDAHAKNYSILHGAGGQVRLAPLYDLVSALPYDQIDPADAKLAMRIGGKYKARDIGHCEWQKLGKEVGLDPARVETTVLEIASTIEKKAIELLKEAGREGLTHSVLDLLADSLTTRAGQIVRRF